MIKKITKIKKIIFATANKNKLAEIKKLLENLDIELIGVEGCFNPEENGETFEENAFIKAKEAAKIMGLASMADDSGLSVDSLGGKPGIHSSPKKVKVCLSRPPIRQSLRWKLWFLKS